MELDAAAVALVERIGLPLAMLGLLIIALQRRWIVMGAESDYREERRKEEREGRLAAEQRLDRATRAQLDQAQLQREVARAVAAEQSGRAEGGRREAGPDRAADR